MKKDRATMSDEQRERQLIAEQIERAQAEVSTSGSPPPPVEEGLKRDDTAEKVILSFSAKSTATAAPSAPLMINPPKANPLKRPNVFKSAAAASSSTTVDRTVNDKKRPAPVSAAERLILEEQERKRRRMESDNAF